MKKTLINTNKHLKDARERDEAFTRNVRSSSAVEGIRVSRDPHTGRFQSLKKEESTPDETKSSR